MDVALDFGPLAVVGVAVVHVFPVVVDDLRPPVRIQRRVVESGIVVLDPAVVSVRKVHSVSVAVAAEGIVGFNAAAARGVAQAVATVEAVGGAALCVPL